MKATPQKEDGQDAPPAAEPHTLSLVTFGRTTGRSHAVVVRFVFHEGAYFVMGGGRRSDWFSNAVANKRGKVVVGDRAETVAFEPFLDVGLVKRLFSSKYGPATVKEWYFDPKIRSLKLSPVPRSAR